MTIKENDPFADAKRQHIGQKRERNIDALKLCASKFKRKKMLETAIKSRRFFI